MDCIFDENIKKDNFMKKVVVFILVFMPLIAFSQVKLEDKSHKSRPDWLHGTEKGYLIVSETASDIESAKQKILMNLKDQIAETVATRVVSESTLTTQQVLNGKNIDFQKEYKNYIVSKSANIPFISEISLSKATDYYWEKYYNKKTKSYYYEYHVKYRLMDIDIRNMVQGFQSHEQELRKTFEDYENDLDNIKSVEAIERSINGLRAFKSKFDDNDMRVAKIDQLITDYQKLYESIVIEVVDNSIGSVGVQLQLNKRGIITKQIPKLSSNCATQFNPKLLDNILNIDFNFFDCEDNDSNWIEIRYKFGGKDVSKKVYIKLK